MTGFEIPEYGIVDTPDGALTGSLVFAVKGGLELLSDEAPFDTVYEYLDVGKYEVEAVIYRDGSSGSININSSVSGESITINLEGVSNTFSIMDSFSNIASGIQSMYNKYLEDMFTSPE